MEWEDASISRSGIEIEHEPYSQGVGGDELRPHVYFWEGMASEILFNLF